MAYLFNKQVLETKLRNHSIFDYEAKLNIIRNWKQKLKSSINSNDERLQAFFLSDIFGIVLGYQDMTEAGEGSEYTLKIEPSAEVDAPKPDGSLGFYQREDKARTEAVINLKGPKASLDNPQKKYSKYYSTPVEQAFGYANKYDGCNWVIVSNMSKIRLYTVVRGQGYYEEFCIEELDEEENFKKFHFLLSQDNLLNRQGKSMTLQLSEEAEQQEEDISVEFYNLYKETRVDLFEHLKENNPEYEEKLLLDKTQKFLDRIIFICFCEDLGLLPAEILHEAINRGEDSYNSSKTTVWQEIKDVFRMIDKGSYQHNINAYNGGLFKLDEVLDSLVIKNKVFSVIDEISAYDFDSELDVNILGHVFEQSISDIEEIKADIQNNDYDKQESKRKQGGIYYTPEHITKYIVENSVGNYLEDIRQELGEAHLPDIEAADTPQLKGKYKQQHLEFYHEYKKRLKEVKILDPACGSGAFLNQTCDFLLKEYQWIHRQIARLQEGQRSIFGLKSLHKDILKNNIYGVDINQSSVEITKLSLWLKTANKNKPLTNLDGNIKCGNSLIDDPEVAGEKAFDWNDEFPEIMAEGGFDVVMGNPPWVSLSGKFASQVSKKQLDYLIEKYDSNTYMPNLYENFIKLSLDLIKKTGIHSFIVPDRFGFNCQFINLREWILNEFTIIDLTYKVNFPGIVTDTMIYIMKKSQAADNHTVRVKSYGGEQLNIKQSDYLEEQDYAFYYFKSQKVYNLVRKIEDSVDIKRLGSIVKSTSGFGGKSSKITAERKNSNQIKVYKGKDIGRYQIKDCHYFLFKDENITGRTRDKSKLSVKNKVLLRKTGNKIIATYDNTGVFPEQSLYFLYDNNSKYSLKYLLALMNSKLITFYYTTRLVTNLDSMPQLKNQHLNQIPIIQISRGKQTKFSELVDRLIDLKDKLSSLREENFIDLINKYTSKSGPQLGDMVDEDGFYNRIYSGRARKVRDMTVAVNDTILTVYADKASGGSYELMKFEVKDKYKRQYIRYYLENFTDQQLKEANDFSGGLVKRVWQIELPNYNEYQAVRKVVNEWNNLQQEIADLKEKIETNDDKIDEMVYDLYGLTDEEIQIVEESLA